MVSRREFLRGGAIASLVTAAPAMAARAAGASATANTAAQQPGYAALCDTRCAEGDAFLGALGGFPFHVQGIGTDPGEALPAIAAAVAARRPIVGLASDAVLTFALQTAGREGYVLAFQGTHAHTDDATLEHHLTGDAQTIGALGEALAAQPARWPELLAHSVPMLLDGGTRQGMHSRRVAAQRPAASRGHLVSFALLPPAG